MALDEGVGNLQRFIAGLQKTSGELGEATSSLEQASGEFSRLESDADESIGGLTEDLEDGRDRLDQAFEEARDAVDEVTEAAEDIGGSRFGEAEERLDEAGQECEGQLAEGRAETEATFARLTEAGFQGYGSALEEAQGEVETLDGSDKEAFDAAEESMGQMRERLDEKRSETGEAMAEAASEIGEAGAELGDAFTAVTTEWKDAIDNELREGCEAAGDELARMYDEWAADVASAADALKEQISSLTAEIGQFIQPESAQALAEAVEKGLNDPAGEVCDRFDDTLESLGAGESLAQSLEGMTPDLGKSLSVVDEVDRLLNAME
jgi:DNA anti-recombination protein RmuC